MLNNQTGLKRLIFSYAASKATHYIKYTNIEKGSITGSNGQNSDSNSRARTADYIPINKFVTLKIPSDTNYSYFVFLYKADQTTFERIPLDWGNADINGTTIREEYPDYAFIRVIFRAGTSNPDLTTADIENFKTMITVIE